MFLLHRGFGYSIAQEVSSHSSLFYLLKQYRDEILANFIFIILFCIIFIILNMKVYGQVCLWPSLGEEFGHFDRYCYGTSEVVFVCIR